VKVGIIDLGTNTFNLLIAEIDDKGGYTPVYGSKVGVKLGEGSFSKNYITEDAMQRAFVALDAQISKIKNQYCDRILAFATAAVRNASNGQQFVDKVYEQFGVRIMVIDGDKEAHMIYQGVQLAGALDENKSLIMDIGGGSTEFIIANDQEILWKKSYEIGVSRLIEKYNPSDPIEIQEEAAIRKYLEEHLTEVFEEADKESVVQLIGSSGSFDTFSDVLAHREGSFEETRDLKSLTFDKEKLHAHLQELIWSKRTEREAMEGMVAMRIKMIVLSAIITDLIMNKIAFENVKLSRYALKEGVLFDVLKGNI
jgi:exopolyphosphatase/guanosine-5'-triphosphate,3'-diphosphate pyrophosphatase